MGRTVKVPIEEDAFLDIIHAAVHATVKAMPDPEPQGKYLYSEAEAAEKLSMSTDALAALRRGGKVKPTARGPFRYSWKDIVAIGDWLGRRKDEPLGCAQ